VKTESRIFYVVAAVFLLFGIVYLGWSLLTYHQPELVGTIALGLSSVMCGMCGFYFGFVARRIPPRPEDRDDAEISDGAGEVGFFSPGSYWPFGLAAACGVAGAGLALWVLWLVAAGVVAILMTTGGLLFEYYTGTRRSAQH
jgi:hypothetical protein